MKLQDSYQHEENSFFEVIQKEDQNRVVYDRNTGLYWEVKSFDEKAVNAGGNSYTYQEAADYITGLNQTVYGGYADWRLPNADELRSIMDYERTGIVLDLTIFGNCQVGDYWTGNEFIPQPHMAWVIFTGFGSAIVKDKTTKRYVMAVRGGNDLRFGTRDTSRFIDNGDGTVTDLATRLMWQKGENKRAGKEEAERICKEMTLAGYQDWRLPNIKEINSIQDLSYSGNSWFFDEFFPAEGVEGMLHYRASTVFYHYYSWVTNFSMGYDGYYAGMNAPLLFRAVRSLDEEPQEKTVYVEAEGDEPSYLVTEDFVKDERSGLTWEISCANKKMTMEEAAALVKRWNREAHGGYTDWRLPLREELRSLMNYDGRIPAMNGTCFAGLAPDFVWTAQESKADKRLEWAYYTGYGCAVVLLKDELAGAFLVRGNEKRKSFLMPSSERFRIHEDKTVTDTVTGLMWTQEETPLLTLQESIDYCKECRLGGYDDWYLPSIKELATIINLTEGDTWFFKDIFPNTNIAPQGFYMSSTIFDSSFGWGCNFQFGFDGYYADKTNGKYPFRPVRRIK